MKEKAIKKINTIGKIGAIVALVARIFMIIGAAGLLTGAICMLVLPKDSLTIYMSGNLGMELDISKFYDGEVDMDEVENVIGDNTDIEMDDGTEYHINSVDYEDGIFSVDAEANNIKYSLRSLAGTMFAGCLGMTAWVVVLVFIEKLCKSFKNCTSPFEEAVLKNLKNFSISMIVWAIVSSISSEVAVWLSNGNIAIGGIDLTYVFIALVILGLTFVFRYGAMLQQESDETL